MSLFSIERLQRIENKKKEKNYEKQEGNPAQGKETETEKEEKEHNGVNPQRC